jgi:hypothetical protein
METYQLLFAGVTLVIGLWAAYGLPPAYARFATMAISLVIMFLGPKVFGRDWYYEGYVAGLCFGDFVGTALARAEAVGVTDRSN